MATDVKKQGPRRPDNRKGRKASTHEKQERKERVLTQGTPSVVTTIADAVVIKHDDLFFLTTPDGRVPLDGNHGFGLYYHDCRFLNGYEINVAGKALNGLAATAAKGFMAVFQLTNPDLRTEDGRLIPKERLSLKWERVIDSEHTSLAELLTFHNFGLEPLELPISLTFWSEFAAS